MLGKQNDAAWLFESAELIEARDRLHFLVESRAPYGHVVADDGSGRTTLLQLARQDARRLGRHTVTVNLAGLCADAFASQLTAALGIPIPAGLSQSRSLLRVRDEIRGRAVCSRPLVLLLDDHHRACPDAAEAIQFLVTIADSADNLTLITAGDGSPSPFLLQRSPMRVPLGPLPAEEAQAFIEARLTFLGVARERLVSSALRTLVHESRGLPRRLLYICDVVSRLSRTHEFSELRPCDADALMSSTLNRAA